MDHAKMATTLSTYWAILDFRVALKIWIIYTFFLIQTMQHGFWTAECNHPEFIMGSFLAGHIHEALYPFDSELFLAILRKYLGYSMFKLGEN